MLREKYDWPEVKVQGESSGIVLLGPPGILQNVFFFKYIFHWDFGEGLKAHVRLVGMMTGSHQNDNAVLEAFCFLTY